MRILITNVFLDERGGTQLYVAELATELLKRGHHPVVFSPLLGPVATELMARTVPVVDDLSRIGEKPDVIHGHHTLETIAALIRFPDVPAIYVTHDWAYGGDAAPLHPNIVRYLAVDDTLRDRLVAREGIPVELVGRTRNWVDLDRFSARKVGLPQKPRKALVFSNQAAEANFLPPIRAACEERGIELDVGGISSGRVINAPEDVLGDYDIVFAKARAAMESMACGCATVLCDLVGLGGMVSSERFVELREVNFGRRSLSTVVSAESVGAAIDRYSPSDAAAVTAMLRSGSSMAGVVDELTREYEAAIAKYQQAKPSPDQAARVSSQLIGSLSRKLRSTEYDAARFHSAMVESNLQAKQLAEELESIKASAAFQVRQRLMASPAVTKALLPLVRSAAKSSHD